ncbi:replication-associated recombination protein A [Oceanisphaera avium]|uniref:Replication-associated recombination protein A n=1 Tax=Oceanisphaera avium TaxID=1903694 RepID=A0A1Y0CXK6_9GAMM|nr:replication-associated recombination protein A [Oceanisphaera avium]ART79616.1 recombination factor protein RarA [Oceanisphaera avium]
MSTLSLDFEQDDFRPLAARMRPQRLEHYLGQEHILAPDKPLRRALEAGQCHSMILWGPPGTGKTTLAELIGLYCQAEVERVSAVTSGVKEIRAAIERAKEHKQAGRRTILFVDEVHRFNKSQQDAFLPHIEDGTVTFIGATTENPSFELNNALLSRARVYVLKRLESTAIEQMLSHALTTDNILVERHLHLADGVQSALAKLVDGDGRKALNYLELLSDMAVKVEGHYQIDLSLLAEITGERLARFDNQGDLYYDLISAIHKSIRGSDPNAGLYWYARMISAGCDALYIARRLLAIASEDIGLADPKAMEVALTAWDCYSRVGPAEGERAIAQAIIYLACAPKSNAVYSAWNQALKDAKELPDYEVPLHLRNAPTKLLKELGHGQAYRYAHHEPGAYAPGATYLPDALVERDYYQPNDRGFEQKIKAKLDYLHQLDKAASNN